MANSVIKCPNIIRGPALNPFFTESEMVTVSMGPGTNAPDNPTPNEVKANKTISIIKSLKLIENKINRAMAIFNYIYLKPSLSQIGDNQWF
jgi:hypothetical protein